MKLPINWPWHRVCTESTGGALSMRSVSLTPCASVSERERERERNEESGGGFAGEKRRLRMTV